MGEKGLLNTSEITPCPGECLGADRVHGVASCFVSTQPQHGCLAMDTLRAAFMNALVFMVFSGSGMGKFIEQKNKNKKRKERGKEKKRKEGKKVRKKREDKESSLL